MDADKSDPHASPAPSAAFDDITASTQPTYAARPRWSHDDENSVTVVQSTHDYTKRVFETKPATARWVRGLAEGEDDLPTAGFRRRTNMNKWEELDDAPDDNGAADGAAFSTAPRRPWLFAINVVGVVYVLLLALRMGYNLHKSYRLDFPASDRQLLLYGRRYGENGVSFLMRVALPLAVPHGVGAVYVMLLSYKLGGAAHHFVGLWGVGLAIISLFAVFTQCTVLFGCCNVSDVSHRWECELPFVFHLVCSVIRLLSPLLALWCVAPVIDSVRNCGWRWKCVLALPCAMALISLGVSLYTGQLSEVLLDVTHATVLLVWPLFIKTCWKQPRFLLIQPRAEKPHED